MFSSILSSHMTGSFIPWKITWPANFYCKACHLLLSKNCLERDYSLISLVLVKLINMSCDKILNEVQYVCFVDDN